MFAYFINFHMKKFSAYITWLQSKKDDQVTIPEVPSSLNETAKGYGWRGKLLSFLRPVLSALLCIAILLISKYLPASHRDVRESEGVWLKVFIPVLLLLFTLVSNLLKSDTRKFSPSHPRANRYLSGYYLFWLITHALVVLLLTTAVVKFSVLIHVHSFLIIMWTVSLHFFGLPESKLNWVIIFCIILVTASFQTTQAPVFDPLMYSNITLPSQKC